MQYRERWLNHLDPGVKKTEWDAEEDRILCQAQEQCGNKWSKIAKLLHGRSENAVKNRWNSLANRTNKVHRDGISSAGNSPLLTTTRMPPRQQAPYKKNSKLIKRDLSLYSSVNRLNSTSTASLSGSESNDTSSTSSRPVSNNKSSSTGFNDHPNSAEVFTISDDLLDVDWLNLDGDGDVDPYLNVLTATGDDDWPFDTNYQPLSTGSAASGGVKVDPAVNEAPLPSNYAPQIAIPAISPLPFTSTRTAPTWNGHSKDDPASSLGRMRLGQGQGQGRGGVVV
jgi:hypothetical protein